MAVPFTASMFFIQNSTANGLIELYDDRVSFDFEVVDETAFGIAV